MKKTPIDRLVLKPVSYLIGNSFANGVVLFSAVVIALIIVNTPWGEPFNNFWEYHFSIELAGLEVSKSLHHWINDGLMAVFFFTIGLELKREIMTGELSNPRKAVLSIGAGLGGMLFPAVIYLAFNHSGSAADGWGIPMATDIAFALGILHFLGKKVPLALKIFLTLFAITDDIGAVLVIALFYTSDISVLSLGIAAIFLLVMFTGKFLGVRSLLFYVIIGIGGFWLSFSMSGVHATISGVLAAFAIPDNVKVSRVRFIDKMKKLIGRFERAETDDQSTLVSKEQLEIVENMEVYTSAALTPLQRFENMLSPVVAFIILPLFALANAGITFDAQLLKDLGSPITYGIILGLIVGKFVGITGMVKLLTMTKLAVLPTGVSWGHIVGIGFIAGIGFTMSLFINNLAFQDPEMVSQAKTGIIVASFIAGVVGFIILSRQKPVADTTAVSSEDNTID